MSWWRPFLPAHDPIIALAESALHLARTLETHDFEDEQIVPLVTVKRSQDGRDHRRPGHCLTLARRALVGRQ